MKYFFIILIPFLLEACMQNPNKRVSVNTYNVSEKQNDTTNSGLLKSNFTDSLIQEKSTQPDTVIYTYESQYSKGDTIIGDYKVLCFIRFNGEFLPAKYYGDSIAYIDENTELLLDVQYNEKTILSTTLTRESFQEKLEFSDENIQNYALSTVTNFRVEKDTLKMEVSLSIPDTDFVYSFELSIANNGDFLIKDVTLIDDKDDIWE